MSSFFRHNWSVQLELKVLLYLFISWKIVSLSLFSSIFKLNDFKKRFFALQFCRIISIELTFTSYLEIIFGFIVINRMIIAQNRKKIQNINYSFFYDKVESVCLWHRSFKIRYKYLNEVVRLSIRAQKRGIGRYTIRLLFFQKVH